MTNKEKLSKLIEKLPKIPEKFYLFVRKDNGKLYYYNINLSTGEPNRVTNINCAKVYNKKSVSLIFKHLLRILPKVEVDHIGFTAYKSKNIEIKPSMQFIVDFIPIEGYDEIGRFILSNKSQVVEKISNFSVSQYVLYYPINSNFHGEIVKKTKIAGHASIGRIEPVLV